MGDRRQKIKTHRVGGTQGEVAFFQASQTRRIAYRLWGRRCGASQEAASVCSWVFPFVRDQPASFTELYYLTPLFSLSARALKGTRRHQSYANRTSETGFCNLCTLASVNLLATRGLWMFPNDVRRRRVLLRQGGYK